MRHLPAKLVSVLAVGFVSVGSAGAFPLLPAAAEDGWGDREAVNGTERAAVLEDGTTMLLSTGGQREQIVYERRRAPDGDLGRRTAVTTLPGGQQCEVADVDVQRSTVAAGVECLIRTGVDDPPGIAVELVWTEADGWSRATYRKCEISSADVSPNGEHAVFATRLQYAGTPQHLTTWSAADGLVDHPRTERGLWGDEYVAGVGDDGRVTVLRTAGFEDEPGYWGFGRLALLRLDPVTGEWSNGITRRYETQGIRGVDLDVAADGAVVASFLRYRSTASQWPDAPDTSVWLLRKRAGTPPTLVAVSELTRDVFAVDSGITGAGVGVVAWQQGRPDSPASTWRAHWPADAPVPVHATRLGRGEATPGVRAGYGLALAVDADGSTVLAWVSRDASGTSATAWAAPAGARRPHDDNSRAWAEARNAAVAATVGASGTAAVILGNVRWYGVLGPAADLSYRP